MGVKDDMAARLTQAATKVEGSLAMDNIAAVAVEIERLDEAIAAMPQMFFPHLASEADLARAAANFGVDRKAATKASVTLTLTGTEGAETEGVKCAADDIIFAVQGDATLPAAGTITVTAIAEEAGAAGNVLAGTIDEYITTYAGLTGVTNAAAATGGADAESDADLMLRVDARWKNPSVGGNIGDYRRWALNVPGVSRVRVSNPSAGNVSVHLVASGNLAAGADLISSVSEAIEAVRPVGAAVTVASGTAVTIAVTANITLASGASSAAVTAAIEAALGDYFAGIAFASSAVSYAKIANLLFVDGVADVTSYAVNGGTSSVTLTDTQFPQLGVVTINAA